MLACHATFLHVAMLTGWGGKGDGGSVPLMMGREEEDSRAANEAAA